MSIYFILNNLHFALETFGAMVFMMAAWLATDAFSIRRDFLTASRAIGFFFLTAWQILHAFQFGDERLQYLSYAVYILGLVFIILNLFLEAPVDRPHFKLILPPIATFVFKFDLAITILLSIIAIASFHQYLKEMKIAIRLFAAGFLFLATSSFISLFYDHDTFNILWGLQHIFELLGFCSIIWWIWQYLSLRIREELVMIFVSAALFISTVATLVFSMINALRIEALTADNLSTNAKLFDLSISNLKDGLLSKVLLTAKNDKIIGAFDRGTALSGDTMDELASSMSLSLFRVLDRAGNSVAEAFSSSVGSDMSGEDIVKEALTGRSLATITSGKGGDFLIESAAPLVVDGNIIGAVVAGFPLDNAFIDNVSRITNLEMSIYSGDSVVASTPFGGIAANRVGTRETDPNILENVLKRGNSSTIQTLINSRPYVGSYVPIFDHQNNVVGTTLVAKSEHDILDISNQTNRLTLVTMLIIMLILITPFYLLTKRLSEEIS